MDADDFARQFGQLYHELYRRAVRRVANGRARLSDETAALLLHLAQAGPMTLSELTRHLDRALSTLSVKLADLEARGLVARQRDANDGRRALIWLSPAGRLALDDALDVLDRRRLADAAQALGDPQRQQLLEGLATLVGALAHCHPDEGDPPDEHPL